MLSVASAGSCTSAPGALALGLIGLVQVLPVVLLALPAGHVADRFDRKLDGWSRRCCWRSARSGSPLLSLTGGALALIYTCCWASAWRAPFKARPPRR